MNFANKLEMAILFAKQRGLKVTKSEIADRLWPECTKASRKVLMQKLLNGERVTINEKWIGIICEMLDVTPNYLFGYED